MEPFAPLMDFAKWLNEPVKGKSEEEMAEELTCADCKYIYWSHQGWACVRSPSNKRRLVSRGKRRCVKLFAPRDAKADK